MPGIRYLVPYEVRAIATDTATGKTISNYFYLRSGVQTAGAPAYGGAIVGPSSTASLLANFVSRFEAQIVNLLPDKYVLSQYEMRAIIGWKWGTPLGAISALAPGNPTSITASVLAGMFSGTTVKISGVTGATAANGTWLITKTGTKVATIAANTTGQIWGFDGVIQEIDKGQGFIYDDLEILASATTGGVATDAVALFATASCRRISSVVGKSYQGRNSFSPIAEADVQSGGFTSAAKTAWATALTAMYSTGYVNDGTDVPGSGYSYLWNVSKTQAFQSITPFTASGGWTAPVTNYLLRPDMGTLLRRKPRLGAVITP